MTIFLKLKTWLMILLSTVCLTMTWVTVALAQAADGDADTGDGDELSAVSVLLVVGALALGFLHRLE